MKKESLRDKTREVVPVSVQSSNEYCMQSCLDDSLQRFERISRDLHNFHKLSTEPSRSLPFDYKH